MKNFILVLLTKMRGFLQRIFTLPTQQQESFESKLKTLNETINALNMQLKTIEKNQTILENMILSSSATNKELLFQIEELFILLNTNEFMEFIINHQEKQKLASEQKVVTVNKQQINSQQMGQFSLPPLNKKSKKNDIN